MTSLCSKVAHELKLLASRHYLPQAHCKSNYTTRNGTIFVNRSFGKNPYLPCCACPSNAGTFPLPPVVKFAYGRGRSYSTCEQQGGRWAAWVGVFGSVAHKCELKLKRVCAG